MKGFFGSVLASAGIIVLVGAFFRQYRLSLWGIEIPSFEFFAGVILLSAGAAVVIWELFRDE